MNVELLKGAPWFQELCELVQQELDRRGAGESRDRPNLHEELELVRGQVAGLRTSLANPNLPHNVRQCVEDDLGRLLDEEMALQERLNADQQLPKAARQLVDPEDVLERLKRLHDVLRSGTPSEINVELAHYIDRILCSADGSVSLRICPFGIAPRAMALVSPAEPQLVKSSIPPAQRVGGMKQGTPRRRAVRRVEDRDAAHFVANPDRFRNLPPDWFWVETFRQPERSRTWPEAHAEEVHAMRFTPDGMVKMSFGQLKAHFVKSKPTLREAIRIAEERRCQGGNGASGDAARPLEEDAQ
jgi:hypothetical protein